MFKFVQSLESRRLFSAVSLWTAEANLTSDLGSLFSDAGKAEKTLVANGKTFTADVSHLKNSSLKTKLLAAVSTAEKTIQKDISNIITTGYSDGEAIVNDVLHISFFDAGNPAAIAKDQAKLAAHVKALQTAEAPLVKKLSTDLSNAQKQIGADVTAIVTATPTAQALKTDWTNLSNAFQSAKQTFTTDFTKVSADLTALTTAT